MELLLRKVGRLRKKLTKGILLDTLSKDLQSSQKNSELQSHNPAYYLPFIDRHLFVIYPIPKKIENFSFILNPKPKSKIIINQPKNLYLRETMTYEPNEY
jgi:hypothetical protein